MPDMLGFFRTWHKNGSSDRAKSKGDNGHPCLVPLVIEKDSEITPFALTLADGVVYVAEIHLNTLRPRPTCRNVASINVQLT